MIDLNDAKEQHWHEQPDSAGAGADERKPPKDRYVPTAVAHQAVQGREADIVRALGISWRGGSDHIHCPYPAHPDKNPSWRLLDDGHAICSAGCVVSGGRPHSVFDVAMHLKGLDFDEAKIRVMELIGREDLIVDPNAQKETPKGLTIDEYAEAKGLTVEWLQSIGVRQTSYGQIPAAVRTPYFRPDGEPSMRFRVSLNGDKNKRHYWRKGDKACLYGAVQAQDMMREKGLVVIVEGESDTQTLWSHGCPAMGLPGAGNWNEERDAHLLDGVPVIYVVIEPDDGGKAVLKWLAKSSIAPRARLVSLPAGTKDPSALYLKDPAGFHAAFNAALCAAQPIPDELIRQPKPALTNLPVITVIAGKLHEAADEGIAAMQAMGVQFYQRNRILVRVARINAKASDGTTTTTPGIIPVTLPLLRRSLGQSALWQKYDKDGELFTIDPPKDVNEQIASMVGEWPFGPLTGVISAPTLRPDGSLLIDEGYDEATGLFMLGAPKMPAIPAKPTRADAERALALLDGLLEEFPFVDDQSKSVALSMLMTPVLRGGLPPAVPIHLVTKPAAGTGGSYLADVASAIATGERCAVISIAPKPEETEKRLIGAAISGFPIIALDNCNAALDGDFICQVSERPIMQLRPLGVSDPVRIANSFTIFANGNQASVTNDVVRRTISCGLDANTEHPEDREFKQNPLAMVIADRGRYIAACLTIARAYIVAGRPGKPKPLLSFERWSDTVRSALMWLGRADPVATMKTARAQDEPQQQRASVFKAWSAEYVMNTGLLTAELIAAAEETHPISLREGEPSGWLRPALHDALFAVAASRAPGNFKIDSLRLAKWLSKNVNNISGVCKLTVDRSDATRPRWRLEAPQ